MTTIKVLTLFIIEPPIKDYHIRNMLSIRKGKRPGLSNFRLPDENDVRGILPEWAKVPKKIENLQWLGLQIKFRIHTQIWTSLFQGSDFTALRCPQHQGVELNISCRFLHLLKGSVSKKYQGQRMSIT
jgi:hypothetical protein